jgi:YbbR domain-containing protein
MQRRTLLERIKENWQLKVIALLLAVAFWFYVNFR